MTCKWPHLQGLVKQYPFTRLYQRFLRILFKGNDLIQNYQLTFTETIYIVLSRATHSLQNNIRIFGLLSFTNIRILFVRCNS